MPHVPGMLTGNRSTRFPSLHLGGDTWGSEQPSTAREGGAGSPPRVRAPSTPHIFPRRNPPLQGLGPKTRSKMGFCWGALGGGHIWSAAARGVFSWPQEEAALPLCPTPTPHSPGR